jgi:hypothetical protein
MEQYLVRTIVNGQLSSQHVMCLTPEAIARILDVARGGKVVALPFRYGIEIERYYYKD